MKTPLLIILIWFNIPDSYSQIFHSEALKSGGNDFVTLANSKGDTIQLTKNYTRLPGSKEKIKPVRINSQNYLLHQKAGVIKLSTESNGISLITNDDRRKIFFKDQAYQKVVHKQFNRAHIAYFDSDNQVVINGKLINGKLVIDSSLQADLSLVVLCAEELIREMKTCDQVSGWSSVAAITALW
ncbi:MAG: hypothetical protein KDC80_07675 [Saprospiraceae bacterium]|nr:hypothetical protein [Saprospiraceae bacterium]